MFSLSLQWQNMRRWEGKKRKRGSKKDAIPQQEPLPLCGLIMPLLTVPASEHYSTEWKAKQQVSLYGSEKWSAHCPTFSKSVIVVQSGSEGVKIKNEKLGLLSLFNTSSYREVFSKTPINVRFDSLKNGRDKQANASCNILLRLLYGTTRLTEFKETATEKSSSFLSIMGCLLV